MARYELTEFEWKVIQPLLPNKPRGVPRVDDRRVLNGIFWVLRSGSPWADVPERYGPPTTIYNRFTRWRKAGVWDKLMNAIIEGHDGNVQMIDSSVVRVHQQAATQNRYDGITYSKTKYKKRNLIERCFNKLKQFRHIATRYDRCA
jgi:transposase